MENVVSNKSEAEILKSVDNLQKLSDDEILNCMDESGINKLIDSLYSEYLKLSDQNKKSLYFITIQRLSNISGSKLIDYEKASSMPAKVYEVTSGGRTFFVVFGKGTDEVKRSLAMEYSLNHGDVKVRVEAKFGSYQVTASNGSKNLDIGDDEPKKTIFENYLEDAKIIMKLNIKKINFPVSKNQSIQVTELKSHSSVSENDELPNGFEDAKKYTESFLRNHGKKILDLQKKLGIDPSGIYDIDTYESIKNFQKKHKLNPDGKIGPKSYYLIWPNEIKNDPNKAPKKNTKAPLVPKIDPPNPSVQDLPAPKEIKKAKEAEIPYTPDHSKIFDIIDGKLGKYDIYRSCKVKESISGVTSDLPSGFNEIEFASGIKKNVFVYYIGEKGDGYMNPSYYLLVDKDNPLMVYFGKMDYTGVPFIFTKGKFADITYSSQINNVSERDYQNNLIEFVKNSIN